MTSSSFVVNPSLHAQAPYDPVKDFSPITIAASSPNVVVVNPNVAAKNMQELADLIRREPDKYSFGSAGIGTTTHLSGELFRLSAGLKLVHVPFSGAGPALQSTVGGYTPITFSSLPAAIPLIKSGLVRPLAVTSSKRVSRASRCADHDRGRAFPDKRPKRSCSSSRRQERRLKS